MDSQDNTLTKIHYSWGIGVDVSGNLLCNPPHVAGRQDAGRVGLAACVAGSGMSVVNGPSGILSQATRLRDRGDFEQAERLLRHLIRLYPGDADGWHQLGLVRHDRLDYAEAHRCLSRALELAPDRAILYRDLGTIHLDAGLFSEALDNLQQAVHLAPHDAGLHHSLGLVLLQYGNLLGARLRLQQAIRLEPRAVDAWFHLGLCCQQQGDLDSAIVCFRRVSELRPDHPEAPAQIRRLQELLAPRVDAA